MLIQLAILKRSIGHNHNGGNLLSSFSRINFDSLIKNKNMVLSRQMSTRMSNLSRNLQNRIQVFCGTYLDEKTIINSYRRNKLDINEWCLVYNEPYTAMITNIVAFLALTLILMSIYQMASDYWKHGKFINEFHIRLHREFDKFGIPGKYLFLIPAFLSIFMSSRYYSMQLSKIYINRRNPNELFVYGRYYMVRRLIKIDRKDVALHNIDFENIAYLRPYYHHIKGDVKFGKMGNYKLYPNLFRDPTFYNYAMGISNHVPKKLSSLDLNLLSQNNSSLLNKNV